MAETKPTKLGRWATDANRTLEPSSGEKDVGWEGGKKPPARFMNFLHWVGYKWHQWLDQRMFDGATAADLEVTGVDAGAGTDLDGGDTTLSGGQATGAGSSYAEMKAATAGAAGTGTRTPETYIKANGANERIEAPKDFDGISTKPTSDGADGLYAEGGPGNARGAWIAGKGNKEGIYVTGGPTNGDAIYAAAAGTGTALRAEASDGHALSAQSDLTSPARSAFRIVPQDADPTIGQIGDLYVTTTGVLKICTNATGPVWTVVGVQT